MTPPSARPPSASSRPALVAALIVLLLASVAGCGHEAAQVRPAPHAATPPPSGPEATPGTTGSAPASPYVTAVAEPTGCRPATAAIVGVKVYLVQQALGLVGHRERYDEDTVAAVRSVQADHGLETDGIVGPLTWRALGIAEDYCVDTYTAQPSVDAGATPRERIEAMIDYARARLGTPYIWGGAGPMGFDCSGLALQAMYAGGRTVPGLDTFLHVGADFRSTHAIYESSLPHARLADRRRGDLVFYGEPITHMAIYLGHGRILEAVRPVTRVARLYADGLEAQPLVVRPFPVQDAQRGRRVRADPAVEHRAVSSGRSP